MSGKSRRSIRRRSSFVPGRVRPYQGGAFGGNLYQGIDSTKPCDERLCQLTKACLQYTLQKMEEEMKDTEDFQSLKKEIEDGVLRQINHMDDNGLFKDYCKKEKYVPNPYNQEMEIAKKDFEFLINKHNQEVQSWERMIQKAEDTATEFKNKDKIVMETEVSQDIKTQAADYLGDKMDYLSMLQGVDNKLKSAQLLVYNHCMSVQNLQKGSDTVTEIIDSQLQKLESIAFQGGDCPSPRTLIESMTRSSPNS